MTQVPSGGDPCTDPIALFGAWQREAQESKNLHPLLDPDIASLSTCSKEGIPSSRALRTQFSAKRGITFFTLNTSRKAKDLDSNPNAALLFLWALPIIRQVRVQGNVEMLPDQEVVEAFRALPRSFQVYFAVNEEIPPDFDGGKAELIELRKQLAMKYSDESIPMPREFTAYCLVPTQFEFYEGSASNPMEIYRSLFVKDTETSSWSCKHLL